MNMRNARLLCGVLAVLTVALVGCSSQSPSSQSVGGGNGTAPGMGGQALVVVTSISPIGDLIQNVVGNRAQVVSLVPKGTDPHDFDPRPADVAQVSRARVFFANGLGEETYLDKLVESADNPKLTRVTLADGIKAEGAPMASGQPGNPHAWLSVANAMTYVEKIRDTMDQADPAGKATYDANATAYLKTLSDLDHSISAQVATIPAAHRKMVVLHDAWPYFCARYGLKNIPLLTNPEAEPSAKEYAAMVTEIKSDQIAAIFGETGFNPQLVHRLAGDTGVQYIDNLLDDTLSTDSTGDTFVKMMQYDTEQIVKGLK